MGALATPSVVRYGVSPRCGSVAHRPQVSSTVPHPGASARAGADLGVTASTNIVSAIAERLWARVAYRIVARTWTAQHTGTPSVPQ